MTALPELLAEVTYKYLEYARALAIVDGPGNDNRLGI